MSEDLVAPEPPDAPETPEAISPVEGVTKAEPGVADATAVTPENVLPTMEPPARYTGRFALLYVGFGAVLAAAITGLIVLVIRPGYHSGPGWSTWKPKSGTAQYVSNEIASHIAHLYRLGAGQGQLVSVLPSPPQVTSGTTDIAIKAVAVRKAPQSNTGIAIYTTSKMQNFTLCGLGSRCSIDVGTPTATRGQLVRREALEVALYTFKFAPGIDSITAFMPPPPGQTSTTLLYLRKDDLKAQLSQPLSSTLPLEPPPLPSSADAKEKAMIDKLTLPHIYTYQLTALQTGGAALILDPAT